MTTIKITKADSVPGDPPAPPKPAAAKPPVRPLVPPRAPSSSKYKNRVILQTLDGKIEWEKMPTEARKAFEELFADPKFLQQFGVAKGASAFKPEQMKALYDGLSFAYQAICGMFLRWPPQVLQLLKYDDAEKEMLAEPTADLINRFAPRLVMENRELVIFLAVFGSVTNAKFMKASAAAAKLALERARPKEVVRIASAPSPAPQGATAAPAVDVPFAEWPDDAAGAVGVV